MPVMDGYELVRQLRLDPATSAIPVVFYTAHYGEREARALALDGGVADVLTKPVESAEVLRVVDRVLSGASADGQSLGRGSADDRVRSRAPAAAHRQALGKSRRPANRQRAVESADQYRVGARVRAGLRSAARAACARRRATCLARPYVTLGILDRTDRSVQRVITCGAEPATWIKTGDAVPGILGTVVAERRDVAGRQSRTAIPPGSSSPGCIRKFTRSSPHRSRHRPMSTAGSVSSATREGPSPKTTNTWSWRCPGRSAAFTRTAISRRSSKRRADELEHEVRERKEAESALRHERDRAQRYLDTAEVILLALDLDGKITLINRKGCDLLGWHGARVARARLGRDLPAGSRA